jgi:exonuclease III
MSSINHNIAQNTFKNPVCSNTKWYSTSNQDINEKASCAHPWVGDVRMLSWNAHGLFINDTIRRRNKLNFLFKTLFKDVDVLCLQEAHLAPRSFALAKKAAVKMGFKFFGVPGDQAVGGVACFCRCSFLETHFQFVEWEEWEPGRHAYLKCFGERGNAVFHDVHFEPNDIPRRKKQISQLRTTLDTFSQHCNFVMGDFNFVMDEVDRMSYGTGHSHSSNNSNDIAFQDLWRRNLAI